MRVELILEAIDRASGPINTVRNALSGVAAAGQAANAAQAGQAGQGGRPPAMRASGAGSARFGGVYVPPAPPPAPPPALVSAPAAPPLPPPPGPPEPPKPPPTPQERRENALQRAQASRGEAQSQMFGAGATAAAIAVPITKAMAAFNPYEDALNDVGQKADLTGAKLAAFGETIRARSRALNMSSTEILKGVDLLAAGGMSVPDAAAAFPALGRAAVGAKASMEDLSKTTVALVNNLKIAPDEVGKALDVMHKNGKDGQFELKDMAQHFAKIGAQYAVMGQTGHKAVLELAAALQIMRKNVGTAGEAVTNLGDLLAKMTMGPALKAFQAAGIDVQAQMAEARKTGRVIETMYELINKATGGDTSKIQTIFHDKQARDGATALIQHYQDYLRLRKEGESAEGVVDRDFAVRMGLGVEKTRALQVALTELWTTLGQALAPAFAQRVEQMTALVNRIEAWVKANPELAAGIAQAATALGGLLLVSAALGLAFASLRVGLLAPLVWLGKIAGMGRAGAAGVGLLARAASLLILPFRLAWWAISGLFSGIASGVASGIAAVGGWGAAARLALGRLVGLFGLLLSPLRLLAQAAMAFGAALLGTPIGWIVAAVAALAAGAYLIYANWGRLGPWFASLWASLRAIFANGWSALSGWLAGLGARVVQGVSNAWASVTTLVSSLKWPELPALGDVFDRVLAALRTGWTGLTGWFADLKLPTFKWPELPEFPDIFAPVLDKLKSGWNAVKTFLGSIELPKFSFGGAPGAAEVMATAEQAAAAKKAIEALTPAAVEVVAAVGAVFRDANFRAQGQAMMTTLAAGIRNGAGAAVAAARQVVQQIRDHLPHSPAKVGPLRDLDRVQFGQTLALAIAAGAPKAVAAARSLAEGVAGTLPGGATPAFATAGGGAGVRGGGATSIHLTFAPTLNGGERGGDMLGRLKASSYELVELIRAELDRRDRAKH